jgi:hypothetical protein
VHEVSLKTDHPVSMTIMPIVMISYPVMVVVVVVVVDSTMVTFVGD